MNLDSSVLINQALISLAVVAAFVVGGKALIFLIDRFIRKLTEKTSTNLDDMLLAVVERPAYYLIIIWGVYVGIHRLAEHLAEGVFVVVDGALFILVMVFVVKLVYDIINTLITWYGDSAAERGETDLNRTIIPLTKKLVKIFVVISGLIVVLDHFHYNISSLVAALGVSSLAIGLAAKDTLSNMISGFIIMADRPFRLGDRIESDGRTGDVTEIGIRSTKMRTIENNIVIIPNTKLVDNVVVNQAYPESSQTNFFKVNVAYGSDVEKVRRVVLEVAAGIPEILKDPAPRVFFTNHGDSTLEFQMMYRMQEYVLRWAVLDKLNTAINRRFAEEGIGMAFPTRTVHIVQGK